MILADGRVAGHWRRAVERGVIEIEALLYEPRPRRGLAKALEAATEEHAAFFGRPVSLEIEPL